MCLHHPEAQKAPMPGEKRKRGCEDCALCAQQALQHSNPTVRFSLYEFTAPSTFPAHVRDLCSTASHTLIPYHNPEWPEHRTVFLSSPNEDILWVCARKIPSLDQIWPNSRMNTISKTKQRNRLIARAWEAHRLRLRRREYVRSPPYQAVLLQERRINDARRQEFYRDLIQPIKLGIVHDPAKIRMRGTLYQAHMKALDEYERFRASEKTYDNPRAGWEYLDQQACLAWRHTLEGQGLKVIRIRFRACVEEDVDGNLFGAPTWFLSNVQTVSNLKEPAEVIRRLVWQAKNAYAAWALGKPVLERGSLVGDRVESGGKHGMGSRRPFADIMAARRGDRSMEAVRSARAWTNALARMFEDARSLERQRGMIDVDDGVKGFVHVYVRPPGSA